MNKALNKKNVLVYSFTVFFGLLLICSEIPFITRAQTSPDQTTSSPSLPLVFLLDVAPPVPHPGDRVTATITQSTFSLINAKIDWFINDAPISVASSSAASIGFTVKPDTTSTELRIKTVITLPNGQQTSQLFSTKIVPATNTPSLEQILQQNVKSLENQYGPANEPLFPNKTGDTTRDAEAPFVIMSDNPNPGPNETITLQIQSSSLDADQAYIQWYKDGKKITEGVGQKTFALTTGSIGTKNTVRAYVSALGKTFTNSIVITPFSLTLYWWTDTVVPYWYKGKAMPTIGNTVSISAFVPAGISSPKTFTYLWTLNNLPQKALSGLGKQTIQFRPSFTGLPDSIEVRVSNSDKSLSFSNSLQIQNVKPEISFCIIDVISGCIHGVPNASVKAGELLSIRANPFFFGKNEVRFLKYTWDINGKAIPAQKTAGPEILNLKTPPSLQGTLRLGLSLESIVSNLQALGTINVLSQ